MNTDISLTGYDPQLALLQRQQKLAELMQQQGQQPITPTTFNGIQAPISPLTGLAKALQNYAGGMIAHNAFDKQQQLMEQARNDSAQAANDIFFKPYMPTPGDTGANVPLLETPPDSINVTPQVGSPVAKSPNEELASALAYASSNNPFTRQIAGSVLPAITQQSMEANQPITPYQQAQLANQNREFGLRQQAENFAETKPEFVQPGLTPVTPGTGKPIIDPATGKPVGPIGALQELDPVKDLGLPKDQIIPGAKYYRQPNGEIGVVNLSGAKSPAEFQQEKDLRTATMQEQMALMGFGPGGTGGAPGAGGLTKPDPTSNSILAQTGLSNAAFNALMYGQYPRGQVMQAAINNEIDQFAKSRGIDTATFRAQAKGYNDVLTNNLHRNNQAQILENEIQGTVQNLAPLSDAIGNGRVNIANIANVWLGKQVNDPQVLQYKDQLLRLREELAGYNAVAGGKLTENGTARVDEGDLLQAGNVLANGINSGGLKGLSNSIAMSTAKNRAVLGNAIDNANRNVWNLFGVGQNYKPQYGGVAPGVGAPAAPQAPAAPKIRVFNPQTGKLE